MKSIVSKFKAHYARIGVIGVDTEPCHVCGNVTDVISIDSSEGEYGPGYICKDCVIKAFEEVD